jgi:hypothetical protein
VLKALVADATGERPATASAAPVATTTARTVLIGSAPQAQVTATVGYAPW